ncbi:GntR family transcriptional regulator, transcriptional repressor for pyruvate dehydrogenase complex [Peptoclostridium litorale DSM 5388]|uniref:Transcriptional regulator, GntR family n=1 Tax=Peptoclostridium litorale DSM 5388 TaxID=1121324 RepID=A0A069REF9_PEPLI|nr:FadR/GntR family transcriptional regulator [Peptoclostridium litorale]KDR94565.1 transcriptional regulator, GntR family [Peptoclostridium litorale DSM 5388]SIO31464.1 GntR family transcriptional regulator, transcriptional repressor for pyruvate dehydrogenase complex [Peptoclostridium litorale DSM 5388]
MIKPLSKKTLYEEVVSQIIVMVKNGEWNPGEKIPGELALSESFGVSRNSVREALKYLALSGIVEAKPGKGTFLSKNALNSINSMELLNVLKEDSTILELMEARLIIEPKIARLAVERAQKEDIEKLEKILNKSKKAIKDKTYNVSMGYELHKIIGDMSRNRVLSKLLDSITNELNAQRFMYIYSYVHSNELENEIAEHMELLNFIKNNEPGKAEALMVKHIETRIERYREEIQKNGIEKQKK